MRTVPIPYQYRTTTVSVPYDNGTHAERKSDGMSLKSGGMSLKSGGMSLKSGGIHAQNAP